MMLTCRLPHNIKAFEMRFEGVDYLVIEKADLVHLYAEGGPAPKAEDPPTPKKQRRQKPAKASKIDRPPLAIPVEDAVSGRPSPTLDMVRSALANGPKTSKELLEHFNGKLTPPSVYTALTDLRKRGVVETRPDEDGTRKNFLVRRAA